MAELDDKLIQNLNQRLQTMESLLSNLTKTLGGVKEGMVDAFNPSIVKSWSDSIKGLRTIRLIDAEKAKTDIKEINDMVRVLTQERKHGRTFTLFTEEEYNSAIQRLAKLRIEIEKLNAKAKSKEGLTEDEALIRETLRQQRDSLYMSTRRGGYLGAPLSPEQLAKVNDELARYKALQSDINKGSERRAAELAQLQKSEQQNALQQELQLNKEIAEEERQRYAEQKKRLEEAQAANKAQTQAEDEAAKLRREQRTAQSKAAYKQQAQEEAAATKKMNQAISQQIQYYRQLHSLYKEYKALQAKPNKTKEDNAVLEQTKQKILEILRLSKQLELENKGSAAIAKQATEFERVRDRAREARGETQKMQKSLQNLLPTLQRLASAFGVAFSVRGLAQFGKKLIETRGEFEMQFVAMKQIIGDVDAATKIWNQTMQQALQSPFKAMQLVTYTKQLAAYRIETEKLFDTTKRLADISAGLGVDMGRLILAYGQVKSANFLRASEVRQFTEAGVNIVGNIAQYFSELENRAVSTADVMERITKRMVLFSDVEEIFKRMTDEGGTFYNMQEVQADTVKGQIAKLHDAYDQMLNTIGQANQGVLRDYIEKLNDLVRNWRTVASFIMKNVNALVILVPLITAYKRGAKQAAGATFTWKEAMEYIGASFKKGIIGLKKFTLDEALGTAATYAFAGAIEIAKMALRTFVPLLAIEGLIWLITKMGEADRKAKELTRSLDEVGSRNAASLQDNIDGFDKLVKKLGEAAEGSQEYLDIRNKIQSQYGEYLDNLSAEQITVENLANAYDRVVDRMREKSRQHIMEEGLQEITKSYGESLQKFSKVIQKELGFEKEGEAENFAKKMYEMYAKSGGAFRQGGSLFTAAYKEYFNTDKVPTLNIPDSLQRWFDAIELRYTKQNDLMVKANSLTRAAADSHEQYNRQLEIEAEHEQRIADIRKDPSVQSADRRNLLMQAEEIRYAEEKLELQKQVEEEALAARAKEKKLNEEEIEEERKIIQKKYDDSKKNLQVSYGAFLDAYNEQVKQFVQERFKERLEGKDFMSADNDDAWAVYNMMVATQDKISQGQTKWYNSILESKKLTEEEIERIKAQQATQTAKDSEASKALNEQLQKEKDRLEIIQKQIDLLGIKEKTTGGGSSSNSIYGERIKLLQDMLSKYRQLAKEAYGYAKAEGKVAESFDDAWAEIMPQGYGALEVPTSYADLKVLLERLESFTPKFDKNGKLTKQFADLKKAIADALSQVDIEMSVRIREDFGRQMEDAFGNYELTLELDKLNIPKEAIKDIFPDFDTETLGELQDRMDAFYESQRDKDGNVLFDEDDLKEYRKWADKIDSEILKSRKEKAKEYSKYLEKEYSERAKLEMQHAKDVAFVTSNISDEKRRDNIVANLNRKFQQDLNELNWKSFKESSFYVDMMDDLASLPKEYMQTMLNKIDEILRHPETLSPRALKEAINARQKILEAQMNLEPLDVMKSSIKTIRKAMDDVDGKTWKQTKEKINDQIKTTQEEIDKLEEEARKWDEVAAKMKVYENAADDVETAKNKLSKETKKLVDEQGYEATITQYQNEQDTNQQLIEGFPKRQRDGEELTTKEEDQNAALKERNDTLSNQIAFLNEIIALEKELQNIREEQHGGEAWARREEGYTSTDIGGWSQGLKDKSNKPKQRIQNLKQYLQAFKNFDDSFAKFNAAINSTLNAVQGMGNAFYDMFDALGGETDALTDGWKEFGNTMITQITQTLTMIPMMVAAFSAAGIAINSALGIIGLIAQALQLLFVAIGAIAKLHDAGYEAEIERQQERIDNLQRAYERLEKQIEKTFDTVSYMRAFREETQNLYEQIDAINKQMAAEEAKKNSDADKIQGYKDSIQDAEDELDELKQKQIDVFGGIGEVNYRSAAEGFVDAWKSAFLETGDGLQGLKDHFDEFLNDWFVKQATMRVAGRMLEPLFRQIDSAVDQYSNGGANVLMQELQNVREKFGILAPQLSEALEELAGMWDLQGEGGLSGLAAGIQGMTEEQANILEAYWNSVRGYTASIDANVATIVSILSANYGGGTRGGGEGKGNIFGDPNVETNPMLKQLNLIAVNTAATHRILESVTKSGHTMGGSGIKVFLN